MTRSQEHNNPYHLETADLNWLEGDTPEANDFADIYFQKQQGLAESQYVFLQQNQLAERFAQLSKGDVFTIGETGFGTGLNFLATCDLWLANAPRGARLQYISTEKRPLAQTDLIRALNAWPTLSKLSEQLIHQYPVLIPGHHSIQFQPEMTNAQDMGSVTLHLLLGDATESLEQIISCAHPSLRDASPHKVDAWFLDGFAPAKNPSLWHEDLYQRIALLSHAGTTLATFTAVGDVRRGLSASGFEIKKIKGFGTKREMLAGQFTGHANGKESAGTEATTKTQWLEKGIKAPWYFPDTTLSPKTNHTGAARKVVIIGGGLAGMTSAYALAKRGCQVTIIERHANLAQEASGNPQGMLYTKLSSQNSVFNTFTLSSYLFAVRYYQHLITSKQLDEKAISLCGLLQLENPNGDSEFIDGLKTTFHRQNDLVQFVNAEQASDIAGIKLDKGGYFLPQSGWISPPGLCHALNDHPAISTIFNSEALSLEQIDDEEHSWVIKDRHNKITSADIIVVANSYDAKNFSQSEHIPLKIIRGQITEIESPMLNGLTTNCLQSVICHEGYITPAINGLHSLGATFDNKDDGIDIRPEDHRRNLENLFTAIPSLKNTGINYEALNGRAGLRCTSPDYLPLVGPVAIRQAFLKDYAKLGKNSHWNIDKPGRYYPGLYMNVAHGSRGLTSTPLCSELLASQIMGETPVIPRHLIKALNPARFVIRDIVRNKLSN